MKADARFVHVGLYSRSTAQEGLLRTDSTTPMAARRPLTAFSRPDEVEGVQTRHGPTVRALEQMRISVQGHVD